MVADVVRWSLLVILLAGPCVAPPPKRPQAEEQQKNDEHVQQQQQAEQQKPLYEFTYSRYLEQVVKVLESDPKFAERLKQMPEADIKSGKIADHIDDLGPDVFEQLTKAKLGEIERLRETITKQIEKDGGAHNVKVPEHLDVNNWEKFGKEDLRKLIVKTVSDMDEIDRQRRDEFKEYEMKKKAEEDHRLAQMTPEERKKAEEEINAQKQRHNDHEKLKHPGSRDQLEEVWEESDNMDKDTFDPRTFFNLHDLNGDGFWSAEELEALFQLELEKVYNETNPDDDPRERIEEMYRMREHVVQQMDKNNDRMISLDEFLQDTEAQTPNKDDGWNDIAKEQIYTDEELRKFEEEYAKNQGWGDSAYVSADAPSHIPANAQHQVPPAGQVPVQQQPVVQQAVPVAQHQQVPVAQQHPAAQQPPQPVPVAHQMPQQQQGGHAQPVPVQQQHAQAAQVNLDGKLMKKEEQKHVRVYKGDRLEDIFFGSSDSESSDDSAYRCRINTDRLKTKPVPLTRRQARSQKTSRPSEAALERRRKSDALDMHSNDESVAEPANDKPSSSRKKPRLASRDENQSERSQKDIAIARIDKKAEKTMIVPQRAEEQNLEPDIDSDIARMRDAILLYNYMSLPGGNTLSTTRPVYRPYLKRTLRYIWNGNARKRSLNEVIAQLHHRLNPEDALFPITSRRIDGVDTLDFKRGNKDENEQNSFTLMFYGIRNRNLAGNREATVDLYLAKDVDGEFQELKHLESRTFTMAVNKNKDVNSIAVSLKEEFSLRLPKGVSKMSYYLVLRVSFSEDPMISSGGRSLRKIPVRQSAMHLNSKELRLTLTPTKTKGDPDELVMFGACLITSISESGHTLPKTSTRNGIVLLETHKISWNAAHWTTDPQLVSRMLKLAKKLHMNPFVLAEFVEDEDIVEEVSDTSIKGEKDASKELISDCNAMEEDGIPAEAEHGRLNDTVACIDVLLNEHFNGDKDTQGLEYSCDVIKKLPATAPIYLVSRISFNPITLHPYYEVPLNTTKKKLDQDWRIECMLRRLHEFTDLTDEEKDFMGLWNMFCLNLENRPTGRNSFYAACRRFLRTYNEQLTEQALQFEWFSHVAYFKGRGFIDEDEAYDLIARCDNPDYSPEEDDLHFVSRDRQRRQDEAEERRKKLEEAGSKRLKESNSSSGGQKDRKDFRHLLPMMSTRTAIKRAFPGSRDSSVLEREESSSVDSSFAGKRNSRHSKEPDYSHYLRDY
ncbi:hypothetical protein QR680_001998 [Steinernema hermaphroditum]|uniref:EF-hand domain-containing protein n=1 Tax=Steinernema hermaphroditum TaxID=289476 RepID=A0AA39LHA0_9BILA|nr:hypothetical protein QR680_001998 [Steinernema hermaphroditum]